MFGFKSAFFAVALVMTVARVEAGSPWANARKDMFRRDGGHPVSTLLCEAARGR